VTYNEILIVHAFSLAHFLQKRQLLNRPHMRGEAARFVGQLGGEARAIHTSEALSATPRALRAPLRIFALFNLVIVVAGVLVVGQILSTLVDFVAPAMLMITALANIAFIALVLYAYQRLELPLFKVVVSIVLRAPKLNPYLTQRRELHVMQVFEQSASSRVSIPTFHNRGAFQ
jgi:hypothetical protein